MSFSLFGVKNFTFVIFYFAKFRDSGFPLPAALATDVETLGGRKSEGQFGRVEYSESSGKGIGEPFFPIFDKVNLLRTERFANSSTRVVRTARNNAGSSMVSRITADGSGIMLDLPRQERFLTPCKKKRIEKKRRRRKKNRSNRRLRYRADPRLMIRPREKEVRSIDRRCKQRSPPRINIRFRSCFSMIYIIIERTLCRNWTLSRTLRALAAFRLCANH